MFSSDVVVKVPVGVAKLVAMIGFDCLIGFDMDGVELDAGVLTGGGLGVGVLNFISSLLRK